MSRRGEGRSRRRAVEACKSLIIVLLLLSVVLLAMTAAWYSGSVDWGSLSQLTARLSGQTAIPPRQDAEPALTDAAQPVAYRVCCGRKQVAVATDMGHFDSYIIEHLQELDAILLESNHDVRMLETGPYPYPLKRRILGDHGHLSNENAGRLLTYILHDKLKKILLGHLSKENNYEELAYETVRLEIDHGDTPYTSRDFSISVAGRDRMSEIVYI